MADLINRDHAAQAIEAYLCSQCDRNGNRECIACPHLDGDEILKSVPAVSRWIPCSEKRPDIWGEYLTYNAENGAMYVLSFSPADNTFGIYDGNVTHWMPLPKPPEKE